VEGELRWRDGRLRINSLKAIDPGLMLQSKLHDGNDIEAGKDSMAFAELCRAVKGCETPRRIMKGREDLKTWQVGIIR
jgi:hypothetical protein